LRGEIWLVNLNPTIGAEISKTGRLPIRLVAPITDWKDYFSGNIWHVRLEPDPENGLTKTSTVDALQLPGLTINGSSDAFDAFLI
jgi:mRNA interferase MazF